MGLTSYTDNPDQVRTHKLSPVQPISGVYILDRSLSIVAAYGSATASPGNSAEPVAGRRLPDLLPPDLYREIRHYLDAALGGAEVSYEVTYPSGEIIEAQAIPLLDKDNTVEKIMVVARNITDRKHMETALADSERFARATIDSLSFHLAIVDANGNILAVNQAWRDFAARNSGAGAHLGVGANYFDVCASAVGPGSDDAASFLVAMRAVLAGELDGAAFEYPCHSPWEQRWFIGHIKRFQGEGPRCLVVSHENITERKLMEIALREREARYRSLFENNYCVMLLTDPQTGVIFDANQAAATYYGWTREELRQRNISDINTLSLAEVQAETAFAASQQRNYFHFRHRRSGGSIRDVEVYSGPIRINDYSLLYSIVHDIGERKLAEEALRHSEKVLKHSQVVAHIGHWTWDLLTNTVVWSDEMKRIFGLDPQAFDGDLNAVIERSIHPEDVPRLQALNKAAVSEHLSEATEYRVVWPDGSIHHVRAIPSERTVDEQGQLLQLAGVVQDITERKRTQIERELLQQQLQNKAEQLAQVMRSAPEGVLLLDCDRRVLMTNPLADALLAQFAVLDSDQRLLRLADVALDALLINPPGGPWHSLQAGRTFLQVTARPLDSGFVPAGWVVVVRDVTAEQQMQQQLQQQERLAAVGQLAAGIAHDFNNILSVIAIYAELLGSSAALTERERGHATTIWEQAMRATRMIRQILDFSRQSVFERHALDLLPLLKEQNKLLRQALPETISIDLCYEPGEYFVRADATRIQQLMMNLAINARDAMPEGGRLLLDLARVTVEADGAVASEVEAGRWLRLTVSDTGSGIAEEHLAHIFEPFFTTKAPGQGTGLGLAQAHGIVAQHDGHILVASKPGAGATFTVYLPELQVEELSDLARTEIFEMARGHNERVLIVEDVAAVRASLAELLALWGYSVLQAANGEEALAFLASGAAPVDLIVSDVVMPHMGGIALVKQLRQNGTFTPVILMSGHMLGQEHDVLQEKTIYAWLAKPPRTAQLAAAIAGALASRGQPGEHAMA